MKLTKEIKIALVAIVGILVMYFGINFLKGMNLFSTNNAYYMTFDDIQGLGASTPIYADGYKVGTVDGLEYDYKENGPIKVKVDINKDLRIPQGSKAEIVKDLMGNLQVNLLLANNPRERVEPGGIIPGAVNGGMMDKAANLIPVVEKMLPKLDSILTSVNALLADPALAASLHNVETITSNLTVSTRELNTLMAGLNKQVPGMIGKANGVLDNTNRLTANLASLDVQGTLNKVNQTLESAHQFTEKLNSNQGSLGLLMNDTKLYDNLTSTMSHADSLVIDLKAHPKRYVHFSVFGRKDK
ncbi:MULTISPECIES: MlaD family protein [Segatella]|jgi:phospholipid/cholesterol/gamma-HCH transport system substrate-binding protein|uniref:MCE family protein n=1 Tax=Segatella copri TaxID=165179 RepID=A0AA92V1K6_9BACT|nr:MlaD family protein [Segatella copri]MCW4084213.1 MlaD family protein [Segatella copri]MCW4085452.1 MlaD family protein [Segatella copri]MCW4126514.1 MlaD family protein [Segatella copri]MCW4134181.1 MlaD family protein [Segatella copri]MCW4160312.1 MlaD family protein [Segatella copri]